MRQMLRKKRKIVFLLMLLSAYFLLNSIYGLSFWAEKETSPITTMETGVFVEKKGQGPIFTMGSMALSPEDISLTEDALISFFYQTEEGVPEEWIKAAVNGEKKGLHLLVQLTEKDLKHKDFLAVLKEISQYSALSEYNSNSLSFWVSLIPSPEISSKEYGRYYHKIWKALAKEKVENISLVWYPQGTIFDSLDEMGDEIDGVGINISYAADLAKVDSLYKIFAGKKEIIINENIIDSYADDLPQGMAFLEEFYYALAIKYPAVTTVYQSSDLSQADTKYQKAMEEFKQKSWVTSLAIETTNKPMFDTLTSDKPLTGQGELLYLPQNAEHRDIAYVEYKFNTGTIIQAE